MPFKVSYVAGAGVELAQPLTDGQTQFRRRDDKGNPLVYEVPTLEDFVRLVNSGSFVAVDIDTNYFDPEKFKKGQLAAVSSKMKEIPKQVEEDLKDVEPKKAKKEDK